MNNKLISIFLILALSSTFTLEHIQGLEMSVKTHDYTPLQQFMMKILINQIICLDNFQLIMKKSNGSPAYVRMSSASIWIERGWAIHVLPAYTKNGTKNPDMFDGGPLKINTISVNYFENTTAMLQNQFKVVIF